MGRTSRMLPRRRFHLSLTVWTLIACLTGLLAGRMLAFQAPTSAWWLVVQAARGLAGLILLIGESLALPLLFASIVTGADGLEPMRGIGRLGWKTGTWIVSSSGVAALVGLLVGRFLQPASGRLIVPGKYLAGAAGWGHLPGDGTWIACVLIALALGIYRNQIEESRARLLWRFSLAVDETLTLLLEWAARILPLPIFLVAFTTAASSAWNLHDDAGHLAGLLGALLTGTTIYGLLLLPLALRFFARLDPWRYALAVGPAVLSALAGGSPAQVFPLTLTRVRTQAGVSNRVASVVLGGCTALLRDGHALGWAIAGGWMLSPAGQTWPAGRIFIEAWLLGCFGAALSGPLFSGLVLSAFIAAPSTTSPALLMLLFAVIGPLGNAVSVFSQTCAAAVIARAEGEANLLPPRSPTPSFTDMVEETSLP